MGQMTEEIHTRNGIVPRVIDGIWKRICDATENMKFELKLSFLEIYHERIHDLLSSAKETSSSSRKFNKRRKKKKEKEKRLKTRQHKHRNGVYVETLNEIYVRDSGELFNLIKNANKKRKSAETKMNKTSPRSHAVLTIIT